MSTKKTKSKRQERTITVSVCHPVAVTAVVYRDNDDEDWQVSSIRDARAEVSPRSLTENMSAEDLEEMDRIIAATKDDR